MNKTQQRIAIAEVLGWQPGSEDRQKDGSYKWDVRRDGTIFGNKPNGSGFICDQRVPDFVNDLNTMMEAWVFLINGPRIGKEVSNDKIMLRALAQVVSPRYAPDWSDCDGYSIRAALALDQATPAQRAEAFLRILDKWKP